MLASIGPAGRPPRSYHFFVKISAEFHNAVKAGACGYPPGISGIGREYSCPQGADYTSDRIPRTAKVPIGIPGIAVIGGDTFVGGAKISRRIRVACGN